MKKKLTQTLNLNKTTVSNLDPDQMGRVLGGSFLINSCTCSDSCSLIYYCCGPTKQQAAAETSGD